MKPKVIVFTTSYYPFIGGAEIAIQEIAKRLSKELDFFIVTARFRRDLPKREVRPEGTILRVGFGSRLDKYLLILAPFYYRGKASIVVGVDISQGGVGAAVYKLLHPRVPFVFNIQFGYGEERLRSGRLGLISMMFRFMLGQADYVTAISSYLLDLARRHYGYKGSAEVIPNGVDVQKFQIPNPKSEILKPPLAAGIPAEGLGTNSKLKIQNSKTIITTSRLVPKNGVDVLIKAVAEVKKVVPDIQCWIVGDGPEKVSYQLIVTGYQLEDNVKFFGSIPYEEIPQYLHEADVFVRPSRFEGMGSSFVEALAGGLPIIGTPVGGITDIIKDGKTGLFCRPDDPQDLAEKIIKLLKDPELGQEIAENGRKMVEERFSWDIVAAAYRRVFVPYLVWYKKVVIATPLFPPDIGGPATYSRILSEELPKRNIGVEVASFGKVRHLSKIIRHAAYFLRVLKAAHRADIVFAQDPVSVGLPSWLAAFILRKPFLLKIVGDYAWEQWQNYEARSSSPTKNFGGGQAKHEARFITLEEFQKEKCNFITELRRGVQHFVARRADKIIVPSNYLKDIVLQWGAAPEKISVIYNSFEYPEEMPSKEKARRTLGLSGTVLISVGRLVPWKGFGTLIELMPEIQKEFPETKLIIIGEGPEEEGLKLKAKSLKLESTVIFRGKASRREVLNYLAAGDIFILNTGYEGLSHMILEAMASGIPIITTAIGGNPELVENGRSCILVEYNDKEAIVKSVLSLLKDRDLRERLSKEARLRLAGFTRDRMIEETYKWLLCAS